MLTNIVILHSIVKSLLAGHKVNVEKVSSGTHFIFMLKKSPPGPGRAASPWRTWPAAPASSPATALTYLV